jgi:uncharacterized membrane protein YkoI
MKIRSRWLGASFGFVLLGCGQLAQHTGTNASVGDATSPRSGDLSARADEADDEDDDGDDGDDEVSVALNDVPSAVKAAAVQAVPGLVLTKAEKETEHGQLVYSLSGTADGVEYEVEVSASGTVNEVERDGGDDH